MNYDFYNPFTSPRRHCCSKPNYNPPCAPWQNVPPNTGCDFCDTPWRQPSNNPWQENCNNWQNFPIKNCSNRNLMWLLSGIMIGKLLDDC